MIFRLRIVLLSALLTSQFSFAESGLFTSDEILDTLENKGAISREDVKEQVLTDDELSKYQDRLNKTKWLDEVDGLKELFLKNHPALRVIDKDGVTVSIYHDNGDVKMVSLFAPVLNGNPVESMIESFKNIALLSVRDSKGMNDWISDAMSKSWMHKDGKLLNPVVTSDFDTYSMVMRGVPPDFFSLLIVSNLNNSRFR